MTLDGRSSKWVSFALRRLVNLLGTLFVLLVITFGMIHLVPGDPARLILGPRASERAVQLLRDKMWLNRPLVVQFTHYAGGVFRLHFGTSFVTGQPVTAVLLGHLPYTLWLAGVALVFFMVIGIGAGMVAAAATRDARHPRVEMMFLATTGLGGAIPSYLAATFLAYVFAVLLRLLPVAGAGGGTSVILPALSLAIPLGLLLARVVRVETLNVLAQDYMMTANSKRLTRRRIYLRYLLPNALNAILSLAGVLFVGLIGGTVVVENVFAWPGLGTLLVSSIPKLDYLSLIHI